MNNPIRYALLLPAVALAAACSDDDDLMPAAGGYQSATMTEDEWYAGGRLGTVFNATSYAFEQPTPATEQTGFSHAFKMGEYLFERDFTTEKVLADKDGEGHTGAFPGLGPVMVRSGCLYCHPNYGHGKRQTRYRTSDMGNGYLLVVYDRQTDAYVRSLAGMPQTMAVAPFKAPIDETLIAIDWLDYTDEWDNTFPDGERYALIYPEVRIPREAFYAPIMVARGGQDVEVDVSELAFRLESTIGIYGTGLTDAIPDDSITEQWRREEAAGVPLNPAYWADGQWSNPYSGLTGVKYARRYTYAMSRGPILDAAGANALWNITNVTRPDRRYHYLDLAGKYYAETAAQDPEVQAEFYDRFPEWNRTGDVARDIYAYLTCRDLPAEMSEQDYKDFMVWHRGLAVPAARGLDDPAVQLGHDLFRQIGCATCHRPSWTTGPDHIQDPNGLFGDDDMPRYPHQTIWPYTDFVQHRLAMVNDIRTGWCRTTPLWGRGLCRLVENTEDRLHDCRARNTMEAIMWHGAAESDARRSVENFRALSKEERDAVVKFIDAI